MQVFFHFSRWVSHTKSIDLHLSDARSSANYWTFSSVEIKHALRSPLEAQSTRRVHGVRRHVLANGSASLQLHPNHADTFRPNPAEHAIRHTKDSRAETVSFGAATPNTFTCARCFLYLAQVNVFEQEYAICIFWLSQE